MWEILRIMKIFKYNTTFIHYFLNIYKFLFTFLITLKSRIFLEIVFCNIVLNTVLYIFSLYTYDNKLMYFNIIPHKNPVVVRISNMRLVELKMFTLNYYS